MKCVFSVESTFLIENSRFVAAGDILNGTIRAGMTIRLFDALGMPKRATVSSVGLLQRTGKCCQVGLVFEYASPEGLDYLRRCFQTGGSIEFEARDESLPFESEGPEDG